MARGRLRLSERALSRRALCVGAVGLGAGAAALGAPRAAAAFGEEGAFNPRVILTGDRKWEGVRQSAPARWADELTRRTSAPGRLRPTVVHADEKDLLEEPFGVLVGSGELTPFTAKEISQLKKYFAMGGLLFVDDSDPDKGAFGKSAKKEIARVLPEASPIAVGAENVLFRSFYLLKRAAGRVEGPAKLDVILRAGAPQVIFSAHDLCGALARESSGASSLEVTPGGEAQREQAVRMAVNVAMYVVCSNYKDDQVHAEHIMRRRGGK